MSPNLIKFLAAVDAAAANPARPEASSGWSVQVISFSWSSSRLLFPLEENDWSCSLLVAPSPPPPPLQSTLGSRASLLSRSYDRRRRTRQDSFQYRRLHENQARAPRDPSEGRLFSSCSLSGNPLVHGLGSARPRRQPLTLEASRCCERKCTCTHLITSQQYRPTTPQLSAPLFTCSRAARRRFFGSENFPPISSATVVRGRS